MLTGGRRLCSWPLAPQSTWDDALTLKIQCDQRRNKEQFHVDAVISEHLIFCDATVCLQ